jgi:hypothetical protein
MGTICMCNVLTMITMTYAPRFTTMKSYVTGEAILDAYWHTECGRM